MPKEKILIVDDEQEIGALIKSYLEKERYEVFYSETGEDALEIITNEKIDLIILDVMLNDIDGIDLCLKIRTQSNIPIIFLSCKSEEIDKIIALSVGGDDYMTKPFHSGELIARIKARLRRTNRDINNDDSIADIIKCPGLIIDINTREVFIDENPVKLTAKEFELLYVLASSPKRVYTIDQLFELVWKTESLAGDSKTIMVYISNLRKKLETNTNNYKYIVTIRGVGYKFINSF